MVACELNSECSNKVYIYTTVTVVYILIIIFIAIFCHGTSLKETIWPRGDLNPRRWCQSTDMLASKPSGMLKPSPMLDGLEASMSVD